MASKSDVWRNFTTDNKTDAHEPFKSKNTKVY